MIIMYNDAEKIEQIEKILQTQNLAESFELVSLALSIQDEEDRDLQLFYIVKWLIANKIWQKSYGVAQLMAESYEKAEALQIIGDYLASIGHLEKAISVFDEAEKEAAAKSLAAWQQAELLHKIAKSLSQIKAVLKADEVWEKAVFIAREGEDSQSIQDNLDSSSVLGEIAEYLAAENKIEKSLNIAQKIKNIGQRERILQRISEYSERLKRVA